MTEDESISSVGSNRVPRTGNSVLIIYTGGTIGMVKDKDNDNALKPDISFVRRELLKLQNSNSDEFPIVEIIEFDKAIDSSDITVEIWSKKL